MHIAVCDDNRQFLQAFQQQLEAIPYIKNVHPFHAVDELLRHCETGGAFDALFLDLDLNEEKTGLQVAESLYQLAPGMPVIFVTGYTDRFVQELFLHKGNIRGFLTKPIEEKLLAAHLQMIVQHSGEESARLPLRTKDGIESIAIDDILYLESNGHLLTIHTAENAYCTYEKLSDMLNQLPAKFAQCHKSFAINLQFVQRFHSKAVLLKNGTEIPVSRSRSTAAKDAYFTYVGRML